MTRAQPARRRRAIAFLFTSLLPWAVLVLGGPPVWAQAGREGQPVSAQAGAGWTFEPSLSVSGAYDSNVTGSASDPRSDVIGRLTPGLGLIYVGPQLTLSARYSIDAEIYAEQSELNNVGDRQRAFLSGTYVVDPLTTVGLGLTFALTGYSGDFLLAAPAPSGSPPASAPPSAGAVQTPSPAVTPTIGVDVGRQKSWALTASPYVTRQLGPATSGTLGYSYTHTEVSDGPSGSEHVANLSATHAFTAFDQGKLGYIFRAFQQEAADTETSHSLLAGWARQLAKQTSFQIEAGPSFQQNDLGLEANARLTHAFQRGSTGLTYSRAQTLVVGRAGVPTVDTVTAFVGYMLARDLDMGLSASFSNIAEDTGPDTRVYGLTAFASYPLTTWAAASLSYQFTREDNSSKQLDRHVVTLAVTFVYPLRLR